MTGGKRQAHSVIAFASGAPTSWLPASDSLSDFATIAWQCETRAAGTRVDGPWKIALNSSLNVARGCVAEVHLAAQRHDVALADAERDDVGLVAQELLAEQPAALEDRPLRRDSATRLRLWMSKPGLSR